jgi:hypothetical protein
MTPKEKAEELVLKFREVPQENTMMWYVGFEISKEFALIAVDEIIQALRDLGYDDEDARMIYQLEVKKGIENN